MQSNRRTAYLVAVTVVLVLEQSSNKKQSDKQTERQTDTPAAKSLETLGKVAQKRATILELKYG